MCHWQYNIQHISLHLLSDITVLFKTYETLCSFCRCPISFSSTYSDAPTLNKSTLCFLIPSVCPGNVSDNHRVIVYFYITEAWVYLPNPGSLNVNLVFQLPSRNIHDCFTHASVQIAQNKMYLLCSQTRFSFCSLDWWIIAGDLLLN